MSWPPHPPAPDDWPDFAKREYARVGKRIAEMQAEIGPDRIIPIPFRCYLCDRRDRTDLAMVSGDGLPLCIECLGFDPAMEPGLAP